MYLIERINSVGEGSFCDSSGAKCPLHFFCLLNSFNELQCVDRSPPRIYSKLWDVQIDLVTYLSNSPLHQRLPTTVLRLQFFTFLKGGQIINRRQ